MPDLSDEAIHIRGSAAQPEISLELTCRAAPEQYDAYLGDELVGYIRLRFGNLSVNYPDVKGVCIYHHMFEDDPWKGCFDNDEERGYYLGEAIKMLQGEIKNDRIN